MPSEEDPVGPNADSLLPVSRRRTSHVQRTDPSLSALPNILCAGIPTRYCRIGSVG